VGNFQKITEMSGNISDGLVITVDRMEYASTACAVQAT